MKHLTLTIEEELVILDRYCLTPGELMFVRTLLMMQEEGCEDTFGKYIQICKKAGLEVGDIIRSLQDKEIILKSYKIKSKGEKFDPYEIPFNKNFIKNLYKCSFEMGKELFDEYPQFGNIQGNVIPLRTVAKKFDSLEQAYFKYGKSIGFNPEKHNMIIDLVKWAKDNNILNCSLASFIVNEGWHDLNALKNGGDIANINYDAVRIL